MILSRVAYRIGFFSGREGGGRSILTIFSKFSRKEITEYCCDGLSMFTIIIIMSVCQYNAIVVITVSIKLEDFVGGGGEGGIPVCPPSSPPPPVYYMQPC